MDYLLGVPHFHATEYLISIFVPFLPFPRIGVFTPILDL